MNFAKLVELEEWVGSIWHRAVTKAASHDFPDAAISLEEVRQSAAVMFRALGGEPGLRIEAAVEVDHGSRRSFLARVAGSEKHVELAWRDQETLRLPARIAWFSERDLNRQLYLWLAALAANNRFPKGDWLQENVVATLQVLEHYPGLAERYQRLVEVHLLQRPDVRDLKGEEAAQEEMIQQYLRNPKRDVPPLQAALRPAQPVPLWLHPHPPFFGKASAPIDEGDDESDDSGSQLAKNKKRRKGERVDMPDGRNGLLAFRLESMFTRADYVSVDRPTEDDEDKDANSAIDDMDVVSIARDRKRTASKLRFDLDLPPEDNDDLYLGEGTPLPEWDYRSCTLQQDHVRLQLMLAHDAEAIALPDHLKAKARRVRSLFEILKPRRIWLNGQPDGGELDINALIMHITDQKRGVHTEQANVFRSFQNAQRDLSCLLLADLSLSTDAHINNEQKVIDVIRDSVFLFSEALDSTGDRFSLYGFSSKRRNHVRFHLLKGFSELWSDSVRGRIQAIRPGYYTRMGAAIRQATALLEKEAATQKLLLILTDGKPNDLDKYEGRYGVEDTRMAVLEAKKAGLHPFCVTIDERAQEYLPYIFGNGSYVLIRNAEELPRKLPLLYLRLVH